MNQLYVDNNVVDKLRIQMSVEDMANFVEGNYSARLENGGKGIFIVMPRAPTFWYKDIQDQYDGTVEEDPHHQAHAAQSLHFADNEERQRRVVYHKFPGEMICDNSFFNEGVGRNDNTLKLKVIGFHQRPLPEYFYTDEDGIVDGDSPQYQFVFRIGWDCVIQNSVMKVEAQTKNTEDEVRNLMRRMNLKG